VTRDMRNNPRTPVTLFVNEDYGENQQFLGLALDMSPKGMSVVTVRKGTVPKGRHTWLRFWLPGSEELISALGEIIHRKTDGDTVRTGVRFKYIYPAHRKVIESFLSATA